MVDGAEFGISGPLFTAGSLVTAGKYRRVDSPGREIDVIDSGYLPASFDGRIAVYARVAESLALTA